VQKIEFACGPSLIVKVEEITFNDFKLCAS
jgi:hypothetical protein